VIAVTLTVNGRRVSRHVEPRLLLVHLLRDELGLTGTHVGCNTSSCGACVVRLDGATVKACTVFAFQADCGEVTTIEALAPPGELHAVQRAFNERHALQCGFCTPGMVLTAAAVVERGEPLTDAEIRHALEGNLCRCTGYHNIVEAVRACLPGA
jgi:carbon-monoxide dehydrogenase small subunit